MIPDGTSLSAVSAARWYQRYNNPDKPNLHIDPYICGTILTYSSNAPIGDSAPTTSTYMTGYPSRVGHVSTYPAADLENDIVPMDPKMAYQPLMTVWEAARLTQNKAVGLVFTCEFPHATPADCMSHTYNRSKYDWIAPQMVHNQIDVVIGGGNKFLSQEMEAYLKGNDYAVFRNDMEGYRNYPGNKMWALFKEADMSYDIDRNPEQEPSLAEMTQKAIEKLSQNKEGFVLMVEGSKIDWAAHANDAAAIITDMLAFDEACGIALDFAKKDGETLVVIVPDHGNSGISIGSSKCANYSRLTKDELFGNISKYKTSADGLIVRLHDTPPDRLRESVFELTGITINDDEYRKLLQCKDYNQSSLSDKERMYGSSLSKTVAKILDDNTCFGFTTGGHTGEEVFLAIYDPSPSRRMTGHHSNIELNHYLRESIGLPVSLEELTASYYAKHTDVFKDYICTITEKEGTPTLEVSNEKVQLEITPNTSIVKQNGKDIKLESVIIYVDKNNTFYLPLSLGELMKS
jgi:Alkaline phosphatase